ncbi:MAG: iron ABC transporter substrate-binding protein [Candidatus Rokuibacteriota bacterium]|nr:MAG: iron ABC transporter substrate-binding protein [Candidatus Rokubacteria bacterium]
MTRACRVSTSIVLFSALVLTTPAVTRAQGSLNVYCSVQAEWCQAIANEFQRQTGVRVGLTLKGSGETLAQVTAESANPKGDVWFGGTGDPHLAAAEQNLTVAYKSPNLDKLHDWALQQARQSGFKTVGIYAGALGFGYNPELLQKRKLAPPACWKDLVKPEYRDEIQVANPNSSGTAYTAIATIVQLFGEEDAFRYLRQLHRNVNQYTRSGVGPIKAVARGETSVSISFMHDGVTEAVAGFPVKIQAPCEGTGYEVGSLSIIKGARNLEGARKFVDWALTPQAQKLGAEAKQFQVPSNREAQLPPQAPKFAEIKLISYDFAKYGASAERKRLLDRWEREVNSQPK